jgi:hypothetical protein
MGFDVLFFYFSLLHFTCLLFSPFPLFSQSHSSLASAGWVFLLWLVPILLLLVVGAIRMMTTGAFALFASSRLLAPADHVDSH